MGLFMNDEIRRVTLESILPLLTQHKEVWKMMTYSADDWGRRVAIQSMLEKHCNFDDFSAMVTQFGYIALFPSAFPLAALMALISNLCEMLSDAFRVTWLNQRPKSFKARNIGSWKLCLYSLSWFSIFSNCWIFSMCSEQMPSWFPQLFKSSPTDNVFGPEDIRTGAGRYVVLLVGVLEHFLAFSAVLINYMISDLPAEVED